MKRDDYTMWIGWFLNYLTALYQLHSLYIYGDAY
jgi:hypothetical protein